MNGEDIVIGEFLSSIPFVLTDFLLPLVVAVVASWITVRLTVKSERRKMLGEIRRSVYMRAIRILSAMEENPTIIFEEKYYKYLKDVKLQLEVYADKEINELFIKLWNDIQKKYSDYLDEFKSVEAVELYNSMSEEPFFEEWHEKEEFHFKIQNVPNYGEVQKLIAQLKAAITDCLRKG